MAKYSASQASALSYLPLWFALIAGPVAWLLRLTLSYIAIAIACVEFAAGPTFLDLPTLSYVVLGITAVTGLVCIAATFISWRAWQASRARAREHGVVGLERTGAFALLGLFLNPFFLAVILAEGLAVFFMHPCL